MAQPPSALSMVGNHLIIARASTLVVSDFLPLSHQACCPGFADYENFEPSYAYLLSFTSSLDWRSPLAPFFHDFKRRAPSID